MMIAHSACAFVQSRRDFGLRGLQIIQVREGAMTNDMLSTVRELSEIEIDQVSGGQSTESILDRHQPNQ
jgi:hypothetical protein